MHFRRTTSIVLWTAASTSLVGSAQAAEPGAEASAGVELGTASEPTADGDAAGSASEPTATGDAAGSASAPAATGGKAAKRARGDRWIDRYKPTRNMVELGIYGGLFFPREHELYDPSLTYEPLKKLGPDIGLRVGYYPLSFLGLEIEGGVMPMKTAVSGAAATVFTFRGHAILQLPYRVAPFLAVGYGLLGQSSSLLGKDIDPAFQYGGGVKFYINRLLLLRLDVRSNATSQYQVDAGRTQHIEALLGLSLTLGRKKEQPAGPIDSDGDGFTDDVDACVHEAGIAPDGCPERDRDGDGFLDSQDACPDEPGIAPDGCPEGDRDGDGFLDSKDTCPDEAGVEPDGCPIRDVDGDGILPPQDKCPEVPETVNGYQDDDGCADEVPKEVAKFAGVIKGIFFDVDKDTIKKTSKKTLDDAVKVLKDFPDMRVEISGHTDSDGDRDHNLDLSARRAESVKKYLVDAGIDAGRLTTRGAGPDEPIADNKTKAGKAQNRRIEFKLVGK